VPFARGAGVVEDAYAVLGLRRGASDEEVRAAWRRVARETHPDVGGDAVAFRVAREAYETLIDAERRAAHDRLLDGRRAADAGAGPVPARPQPVARTREWVLIVANVVVVLRALDVLRGARVLPPRDGAFLFPLPDGGVRVWVAAMDLLGLPWVFLVLAGVATATLVTELVHERCEGTPLLDAEQRAIARGLHAAVPAPLALGVAISAAVIALQVMLSLLIVATVVAGVWLVLRLVAD
jgi:hypothetical protein